MALKITKAEQSMSITNLTVCLYGQPGIGKTSTAFTAEKPLLLDFDNGAYRSANRKDAVEVADWKDVAFITKEDLASYQTIILDTAGRALDVLQNHIIASNPKAQNKSGGLTLQGFGALKQEFISWLKMIRSFGKDIVLLAHMDEQRQGDDIIERLDITGGSKNEIYKVSDAMGRLRFDSNKRVLDFSPSSTGFGKNPAQLALLNIPNFAENTNFLGEVIQSIKDGINKQTEDQKAYIQKIEIAISSFSSLETLEEFNNVLAVSMDAEPEIKRGLVKKAEDKGFVLDKSTKQFILKQEDKVA